MPHENIELLIKGARSLKELRRELVFVGGCTVNLLITDPAAPEVRATDDVDVIAEIGSHVEYYALAKRLRALGFSEDPDVICRWRSRDQLLLDVMPTDAGILGFSNQWYPGAMKHSGTVELEPGVTIRLVTPPYFCATKIEAFHGRGKHDYVASHDLEDLIAVVDGRSALAHEVRSANTDVRNYIATEVGDLLRRSEFLDALPGHLPADAASQARLPLLTTRLHELASD